MISSADPEAFDCFTPPLPPPPLSEEAAELVVRMLLSMTDAQEGGE